MWRDVGVVSLIAKADEMDLYIFNVVLNDNFKGICNGYIPYTPLIQAEYDHKNGRLYINSYIRDHDRNVMEEWDGK
jgi:hypothetical protein|nr:MAG TPA: hypothetical protein [Caudoviricetes sp.]